VTARALGLALLAASVLVPRAALADVGDEEAAYDPGPAVRRSGFVMALDGAFAVGTASGYPLELAKIDDPAYEASTGFGTGGSGGLMLGGALRDELLVGVGFRLTSLSGGTVSTSGFSVHLHLETFPWASRGGLAADLGLFLEAGAGGRVAERDGADVADGGALSVLRAGAALDALRLSPSFSVGPVLTVSHEFSQSMTATLGTIGVRLLYQGGPG